MSRGEHAASDASFARSARGAALRGAALIVAALLLGWVLLRATDASDAFVSTGPADDDGVTVIDEPDEDADTDRVEEPTVDTEPPPPPAEEGERGAGPRPVSEVQVVVANGTDVAGAAGRVTERVRPGGWNLLDPANATENVQQSVVYFQPGYEAEAQALAGSLDPAPQVQPMPEDPPIGSLGEANLLLVVGPELAEG